MAECTKRGFGQYWFHRRQNDDILFSFFSPCSLLVTIFIGDLKDGILNGDDILVVPCARVSALHTALRVSCRTITDLYCSHASFGGLFNAEKTSVARPLVLEVGIGVTIVSTVIDLRGGGGLVVGERGAEVSGGDGGADNATPIVVSAELDDNTRVMGVFSD